VFPAPVARSRAATLADLLGVQAILAATTTFVNGAGDYLYRKCREDAETVWDV